MLLMIIAVLIVLGLCFGSFINALVWRMHEHRNWLTERSECTHCHRKLSALDLIPIVSWLWLRGRCRYCKKSISWQYPAVEAVTALLFIVSYLAWPVAFTAGQYVSFVLWLVLLIGLIALTVYDLRWMLLPNKIVWPLSIIAVARAIVVAIASAQSWHAALTIAIGAVVGGGIFYILYQFSDGRWIGGGDVKLGLLLGIIVGTPAYSFMLIFFASILGALVSLPLLASKRLKRNSQIPFGPFLIAAAIIVLLWGGDIWHWYQLTFIPYI